jgi:dihydrofolate synthase/folylpolyglutamate synthase
MTPRERIFALEQFGIKLGLESVAALLAEIGNPHRAYRVVHVAGTNGKGSVVAMVERGVRAAGRRTGRYTSPHLDRIEERIAIDGRPVGAAEFDAAAAVIVEAIDRLRARGILPHLPTFFEATTAMAFEIFRRRGVEVAVVEVGLGGRFDATNVVEPLVTAITSIALDHERHLGRSIAEIAFEKAGIVKPGVPVVVGGLVPEAREVVERVADERSAPIIAARPAARGTPITLALHGAHQHDNAAIAVAVLRACDRAGLRVERPHVVAALTDVEWPARLEWLRLPRDAAPVAGAPGALPEEVDVLLDAAHNPAGAAALASYLRSAAGRMPIVLGVASDKDAGGIAAALASAATRFIATQAASPRALPAGELAARIARAAPDRRVDIDDDPESALARAWKEEPRAAVAGSILLVGPLRARLLARGAHRVRYPAGTGPFLLD